jgi:two-component system sensor histidine kinase DesK
VTAAILAPRIPARIVIIALWGYFALQLLNVYYIRPHSGQLLVCLISVIGVFAIQLLHCARSAAVLRARYAWVTLPAQVVLAFLPVMVYQLLWGSFSAFPAASMLLLIPAPLCWLAFGGVVGATIAAVVSTDQTLNSGTYLVVSGILTALIVVGLTRLADVVAGLHAARAEKVRLGVEEERLRFARDLHDLLGGSLSAILLKGQLARDGLPDRPDEARDQLDTLLKLSRQALTEVRATARSYRDMSLTVETRAARSVLAAADIDASVLVSTGQLSGELDTLLAIAIRESVTNLLQHSTARRCEIEATRDDTQVRLVIRNDGASSARAEERGDGLAALANRLATVEGTLTAEQSADWFEVVATVPLNGTPAIAAG